MPYSLIAQIKEVEREIALRRSVYPRLVGSRKMKQGESDMHIDIMIGVLETLKWLQANETTIKAKIEPKDVPNGEG